MVILQEFACFNTFCSTENAREKFKIGDREAGNCICGRALLLTISKHMERIKNELISNLESFQVGNQFASSATDTHCPRSDTSTEPFGIINFAHGHSIGQKKNAKLLTGTKMLSVVMLEVLGELSVCRFGPWVVGFCGGSVVAAAAPPPPRFVDLNDKTESKAATVDCSQGKTGTRKLELKFEAFLSTLA